MSAEDRYFFRRLLKIYIWILSRAYDVSVENFTIGDISMQFIVKDDNPDVGFRLVIGEVKDSEGNVIDNPTLNVSVESSDTSVLGVTFDPATNAGSVKFGNPGSAAISVEAKDQDGNVLAAGGSTFTLTTGDPKSISSIDLTFDGLTPVETSPANPADAGQTIPPGVSSTEG